MPRAKKIPAYLPRPCLSPARNPQNGSEYLDGDTISSPVIDPHRGTPQNPDFPQAQAPSLPSSEDDFPQAVIYNNGSNQERSLPSLPQHRIDPEHILFTQQYDAPSDLDNDPGDDCLDEFRKKWLLCELKHRVSKCASNDMWKLALEYVPRLNNRRKIAQFQQQRRNLHSTMMPQIQLSYAFLDKNTDEILEINNVSTEPSPRKFPADKFTKIYDMATIQVTFNK